MVLETERLVLRPWEESDAESLYEYAKNPEVGSPAGWPAHGSVEESLFVIKNFFCGAQCYAICEKETGRAIGAIELKLQDNSEEAKGEDECELGYWIGKTFWGRGYVPEVAKKLLEYAFETLGMKTVWCCFYEGNVKSQRVAEKLGFVHHHSRGEVEVPLLGERRVEIAWWMTKEMWGEETADKM